MDEGNGIWNYPSLESHWIGNWTLNRTRFRAAGTASAGGDLIDRVKWRMGAEGEAIFYSEYLWDTTCARMVGLKYYDPTTKRSPIRVLRKIQGNRSGSTSTRNDWFYGTHVRTRLRLRVHAMLPPLRLFVDYLKNPTSKNLFTRTYPGPGIGTQADTIDGLGSLHVPITSYEKGNWIRWDTQVTNGQNIYWFFRETRPLFYANVDQDYVDDGTADSEAVGVLQKEVGRYGNHGLKWSGPSAQMQDVLCDEGNPDDPQKLWREGEFVMLVAPSGRSAADVEDWLLRPVAVYPMATSLPYNPPPPPGSPCVPSASGNSPSSGMFAELSLAVSGGCAGSTTGISVFRAVGSGAFRFLGHSAPNAVLKDASVVPGVVYKYKVYGHNRNGVYSASSNTISLLVQDTELPAAPTNPSVQPLQSGGRLVWTPSSSWDAVGHDVYLSTTPGGPYLKVTSQAIQMPTAEYTMTGLDPSENYYVVIQAVDRVGNHSQNSSELVFAPLP